MPLVEYLNPPNSLELATPVSLATPMPVTGAVTVGNISGSVQAIPFTSTANYVRGGNTTGNTSAMQLLPAAGTGLRNYITDVNIGNTGNATVNVTLNDSASTVLIAPSGGGNNIAAIVPMETAANTALTATLSGNTTSVTVAVRGFTGA